MTRQPPYRDGTVHVLTERCSTCVFRPGNPMHLPPGRLADIVDGNLTNGAALTCHQTLPYGDHPDHGEALCRGFWDGPGATTPVRVLADALNIVTPVTPPTKGAHP